MKHLPRSDALASASTPEEIINAPRLREVVSTKKVSEVYTEEGYKDSAYDHGGFAKEAENDEGYDRHEGGKHKRKPGKQKTGAHYDDSESQGTQTQVKKLGTEGEKLNNSDSAHPLNTWMRHEVTRNETRLMFVENEGEDGVPMKVVASYSHTIQHPGGNMSHRSEYPSTRTALSSIGRVKDVTNSRKQLQEVDSSNIQPQSLKFVNEKPEEKEQKHQQQQQQQHQQLQHQAQQQQPYNQKHQHQQQQQQQHQLQQQPYQKQQPQQHQQKNEYHHNQQQQQEQQQEEEQQEQQRQDQHKEIVPFLLLPTETHQPQVESRNSYNQLMENLYGTALRRYHRIRIGKSYNKQAKTPLAKNREGKALNQHGAVGLSSNSLSEQQHEGSSVSVQHVQPGNTNADAGFATDTDHNFVPARTATKLDSIYQRKHPSIPLEEIQNLQHAQVPVLATSRDFTRRVEQHDILTTSEKKEYPNQDHNSRYVQLAILQDRQDPVVTSSRKSTPAIKYTSKYKEIRKLKPPNEQITSTKLLPTFEDPLSLWAKFIEALTLAQYSPKGKNFQDPRQEAAVTVGASSTKGSVTSTPVGKTHSILQHAKEHDKKTDYHGVSTQTLGDSTAISLQNISQSELIPLVGALKSQNLLYTSVSPRPILLAIVKVESSSNGTQNNNASLFTDLQTEESEREYKEAAPGSNLNTDERTVRISRRRDTNRHGTPQYLSGDEEEIRLQEEERLLEEEKDKEIQNDVNEWKNALQDAERGIIRTPQVNTRKYPFYKSLPSDTLSLYSPLRYATNPKAIPLKTEGGMEFYESRDNVQCPEVKGPQDVVPKRTAPGEWNKKPRPNLPRLRGLGDKIDCLRTKYFGSDPLDNPFFKENAVGLPQATSSDNVESVIDDDALRFYADIREHIRNFADINNIPTYSMPEPQYAEFKSPAEQNVRHASKLQEGGNENNNSDFPPMAGQYAVDTSSSHNAIKNNVWPNTNTGYPPSIQNEGTQVVNNDKYHTNTYVFPLIHKYRNITVDSLQQSNAVPGRTPVTPVTISSALQGPHYYAHLENGDHSPRPSENTYKPQHQEVIIGMVPPPVPTPSYLIIKTAPLMPKIYPTSILSLLSEPTATVRPHKTLANPYYYRNIQGLVPPSMNFHTKGHVHHEDNDLTASNTGRNSQFTENLRYGGVRENPYKTQVEINADIMVAEETSKSEIVSDVEVTSLHTDTNMTLHRDRRGAKRYDEGNYDELDNDEHSKKSDDISRSQNRKLNVRKQIKGDKSKRTNNNNNNNNTKKQSARSRNSLDKLRRRMDQEDDLEYQYDDDDVLPNRKGNKIRKGNRRRENSDRRVDDVLQYPDYVGTDDYDAGESELRFSSNPTTEAIPKAVASKKAQIRTSGNDSRRGEPRYNNSEGRRKGDNTKTSRIRTETKTGESVKKENKRSSLKKGGSHRSGKTISLKLDETKLNNNTKNKLSCKERNTEDGCKDYQSEQKPLSSEEHKDDNLSHIEEPITDKEEEEEKEEDIKEEATMSKYQKKINSTGFKRKEETEKESDVILQEASKNNVSVNKSKSKYPDSVLSADQINRILGGFMSRHNPAYSSRYKADETTVVPESTDSTTVTTSTTSSTASTSTASNRIDEDTKGPRSKVSPTSSGKKDFQKARVIPILNTKVIPELVTSTTKSPETNTYRRRVATSRSDEKQESLSKSSKSNKAKTSRPKKIARIEEKREKQEETESRREEKPEYVSSRNISVASKDKTGASRRRNTGSRENVRKQNPQTEAPATTTEAIRSRKRIPIRIKSDEKESNDTSSTSTRRRPIRKGGEKILTQQSTSNSLQAENSTIDDRGANETENSTTSGPRRLQAFEHRRVTKEEIFTTTYYPDDELAKEMERQSELDADELEATDESRETVVRQDSEEEEDEDDDIYEPFESYNYESRHVQYPGNRLHKEDNPYSDKNWNSKRGYYIHHAPDHPPYNHHHISSKRKEQKGTQKSENNYDYGQAGHREDHSAELTSDTLKYADTDNDSDGPSPHTQTAEDPRKVVTKEGIKGFYIQRSSDRATAPSSKGRNGDDDKKSAGEVLTYLVNQNTGKGTWVSGDFKDDDDRDATDIKKTTGTGDKRKGEAEVNEPARLGVRGSAKSRNNWKMTRENPPKKEESALKNDENEEARDITNGQSEENGRDKQADKYKGNRGKSQKRNYSSDHESEKDTVNVSIERANGDRSLKRNNIKKIPQNKPHNHPGNFRQKGSTETLEDSADGYSNLNQGDGKEKIKKLEKAVRKKAEDKEEYIQKDGANNRGSDAASRSEKPVFRRNKSRRYKDQTNQFKDTDANIKSSASELHYYEEVLPEEAENNEHQKEKYNDEMSAEEQEEDGEEYDDESTTSATGTVLREMLPKSRDHSEDEKVDDHVLPRYVKHPGERYYYYADEPEETLGKEGKDVLTDRKPMSYRNKELRSKDDYIED